MAFIPRLILLNGPPRAGKDTAAQFICKHYKPSWEYKISTPLKRGVKAIWELDPPTEKYLEKHKDELALRFDPLNPRSYRTMQIELFEFLKVQYGSNVLGRLAASKTRQPLGFKYTVISDCGRLDELPPILDNFRLKKSQNYSHVLLIRIHRDGCDFESDIREWIHLEGYSNLTQVDLNNDYDLDLYEPQVVRLIREWESNLPSPY